MKEQKKPTFGYSKLEMLNFCAARYHPLSISDPHQKDILSMPINMPLRSPYTKNARFTILTFL